MTLRRIFRPLPVLLAVLLAACGETNKQDELLDATLRAYGNTMRWGEIEQALAFMSPADLEAHPIPPVELERYHQVRIVGYREQGMQRVDPGHARQTVALEIVNQHTQVARSVVDHQEWQWDPVTKHWWLTSGLPKLASGDTRR
jgi:hypothetical protein